jgi:hypothetical protein
MKGSRVKPFGIGQEIGVGLMGDPRLWTMARSSTRVAP